MFTAKDDVTDKLLLMFTRTGRANDDVTYRPLPLTTFTCTGRVDNGVPEELGVTRSETSETHWLVAANVRTDL